MKRLLQMLSLVLLISWTTACSDSEGGFYQYVDDDCVAVVSVDLLNVMQNAGFTFDSDGMHAPAYVKSFSQSVGAKSTLELLESVRGIDPKKALLVAHDQKSSACMLFKISDKGDLVDYLKSLGFEKSNGAGYDVYAKMDVVAVIDDGILIVIPEFDQAPASTIDAMKQAAQKAPIAGWKASMLSGDETAVCILNMATLLEGSKVQLNQLKEYGCENIDGLTKGSMVYAAKLKGNELKFKTMAYDAAGKRMSLPYSQGSVDKKLLKYTSSVDFAVALFGLPDDGKWKSLVANIIKDELRGDGDGKVQTILSMVNGKAMVAFGYSSIQSLRSRADCHYALAIQAEKGKGHALYDQVRELINLAQMPYVENGNTMILSLGDAYPSIYVTEDGDNLVVSSVMNPAVEGGNSAFKAGDFDNGCFEMLVKIPAQAANLTFISLPFGIEFESSSDKEGSESEIELTDCDGSFLENVLKTVTNYR